MKKKTALQLNLCDGGQFVLVVVCVLYYCLPRGRKNNNRSLCLCRVSSVSVPCFFCVGAVSPLCPCRVSSVLVPCLLCVGAISALCLCRASSVPVSCLPCARCQCGDMWDTRRDYGHCSLNPTYGPHWTIHRAPDWIRLHPATTAFTPQTKLNFFSSPAGFYTELKTPHLSYIDVSLKCCLMDSHWNSMRQSQ